VPASQKEEYGAEQLFFLNSKILEPENLRRLLQFEISGAHSLVGEDSILLDITPC
jgi:hypothetical protein